MNHLPFAVTLNGMAPDIPGVLLDDVAEMPPALVRTTAAAAGGIGSFVLGAQRQALRVKLLFRVPETEPARRVTAIDALRAWAVSGGALRLGCRPGLRLWVRCEQLPAAGSYRDPGAQLSVVFAACEVPFWTSEVPLTVYAGEGTAVSAALSPAGTAEWCPLQLTAVNAGTDTLTSLRVVCAESADLLKLEGLSVPPGDVVRIRCGEDGRLLLRQAGSTARSLLSKRTADSSDLPRLLQRCCNHVTVTADQPVAVTLSASARQI